MARPALQNGPEAVKLVGRLQELQEQRQGLQLDQLRLLVSKYCLLKKLECLSPSHHARSQRGSSSASGQRGDGSCCLDEDLVVPLTASRELDARVWDEFNTSQADQWSTALDGAPCVTAQEKLGGQLESLTTWIANHQRYLSSQYTTAVSSAIGRDIGTKNGLSVAAGTGPGSGPHGALTSGRYDPHAHAYGGHGPAHTGKGSKKGPKKGSSSAMGASAVGSSADSHNNQYMVEVQRVPMNGPMTGGKRCKSYAAPKGVWKNNGGYNATIYVRKRRLYGPIRRNLDDAIVDRHKMEDALRRFMLASGMNASAAHGRRAADGSDMMGMGYTEDESVRLEILMRDMVAHLRNQGCHVSAVEGTPYDRPPDGSLGDETYDSPAQYDSHGQPIYSYDDPQSQMYNGNQAYNGHYSLRNGRDNRPVMPGKRKGDAYYAGQNGKAQRKRGKSDQAMKTDYSYPADQMSGNGAHPLLGNAGSLDSDNFLGDSNYANWANASMLHLGGDQYAMALGPGPEGQLGMDSDADVCPIPSTYDEAFGMGTIPTSQGTSQHRSSVRFGDNTYASVWSDNPEKSSIAASGSASIMSTKLHPYPSPGTMLLRDAFSDDKYNPSGVNGQLLLDSADAFPESATASSSRTTTPQGRDILASSAGLGSGASASGAEPGGTILTFLENMREINRTRGEPSRVKGE